MKNTVELPEKLDFVKLRKEMYHFENGFDSDQEEIIREIVAREINLLESKINALIDYLMTKEEREG